MFIRYILYVSIFCMLPLFSYAAENKSADYDFSSNQLTFKNAKGEVIKTFTIQELQELFPQKIYDTETPWSEGKKALYRGPRVKDILENLKIIKDSNLKVAASDGYISRIKSTEIQTYDPILATEIACSDNDVIQKICQSGQKFRQLKLEERGPIRMIWPAALLLPICCSFPWVYHISIIELE